MAVAETSTLTPVVHPEPYDEISLIDIFLWVARWWWVILIGGAIGLLAGFAVHLVSQERSVVSLDIAITEMPLGERGFIQDVSIGILRNHMGTKTVIQPDSRKGTLSLIERDVPDDAIAARKAAMLDAAKALSDTLQVMVTEEYGKAQASFSATPPSPETYTALKPLRLYLAALDEGLIEPITVVSQGVRGQVLGLMALLVIGTLGGAGIGVAGALVADQLLRQRKKISAP